MKWDSQIFRDHFLVASPSQVEDALECARRWWLKKVIREPFTEDQSKFQFGHVIHEVAARYLRDEEPFPEGWAGTLPRPDASRIRALIETTTVLRRRPGLLLEAQMARVVAPHQVAMIGAIDVLGPDGIEDHKAVRRAERALDREGLESSVAMLIYAREAIWRGAGPSVSLRYNYFAMDTGESWSVDTTLTNQTVLDRWDRIVMPALRQMWKLKKDGISRDNWENVEGPRGEGACKWCPFWAGVCGF